jgi:hypothetical protein
MHHRRKTIKSEDFKLAELWLDFRTPFGVNFTPKMILLTEKEITKLVSLIEAKEIFGRK